MQATFVFFLFILLIQNSFFFAKATQDSSELTSMFLWKCRDEFSNFAPEPDECQSKKLLMKEENLEALILLGLWMSELSYMAIYLFFSLDQSDAEDFFF